MRLHVIEPKHAAFEPEACVVVCIYDEPEPDFGGVMSERDRAALARLLRLVQVRLFREGQSALVYHAPPPWDNCDIDFLLFEDGSVDGVDLFPRNSHQTG